MEEAMEECSRLKYRFNILTRVSDATPHQNPVFSMSDKLCVLRRCRKSTLTLVSLWSTSRSRAVLHHQNILANHCFPTRLLTPNQQSVLLFLISGLLTEIVTKKAPNSIFFFCHTNKIDFYYAFYKVCLFQTYSRVQYLYNYFCSWQHSFFSYEKCKHFQISCPKENSSHAREYCLISVK